MKFSLSWLLTLTTVCCGWAAYFTVLWNEAHGHPSTRWEGYAASVCAGLFPLLIPETWIAWPLCLFTRNDSFTT